MLHLTKLNTVAKCGKLLFATNFPDILLSSQVIPTAATSVTPTDVKLTTYFNSKLAYLYHNHLATIEEIYIDLLNRECKFRKEILKTKQSIAISNNDISLPLIHHRRGTYARMIMKLL